MKTYKKETKEIDVLDTAICDKCGEKMIFDPYKSHYDYDWFEMTTGHGTPDGGNGLHYSIDLCESCGIELINFLKVNGYNIRTTEWDY